MNKLKIIRRAIFTSGIANQSNLKFLITALSYRFISHHFLIQSEVKLNLITIYFFNALFQALCQLQVIWFRFWLIRNTYKQTCSISSCSKMVKKTDSTQLTLTTIANPVVKLVGCLTTQSPVFDIHLVLPKKSFFLKKKRHKQTIFTDTYENN